MSTPATIEYDREARAIYVRLCDARVARTTEDAAGRVVDYAADGTVVGIELLGATGDALSAAGDEYGFADFLAMIREAAVTAPPTQTLRTDALPIVTLSPTEPATQSRPRVPVRELQAA